MAATPTKRHIMTSKRVVPPRPTAWTSRAAAASRPYLVDVTVCGAPLDRRAAVGVYEAQQHLQHTTIGLCPDCVAKLQESEVAHA